MPAPARAPRSRRALHVQFRRRAHDVHPGGGRAVRRRPLLRPARRDAALQRAGLHRRRELLHRGPDVRRLLDPRLPGHPRVRHEAPRGHLDGVPRPVPGAQDARHQHVDRRPVHGRAVQPRPPPDRREGRGVPQVDRHRRHRVLRPRGGVLHLRRHPLPHEPVRELLPHRLHRGGVEHGPQGGRREPRAQDAVQGRVLPRAPGGPLRRPARRDLRGARQGRSPGRAVPPRGRDGRSGGDQLPLRHAGQVRRQGHAVQVRRQERGAPQRADRHLHAEAALR